MKKRIAAILLVLMAVSLGAEEQPREPTGAVSILLVDSLAFTGLGVEFFAGQIGLGGTFTCFLVSTGEGSVFLLEPGAYARLYMDDPESSMFLMGGLSYFTIAGGEKGDIDVADEGLLNLNAGFGFNSFFGKRNNARFSIEIGPRYTIPTVDTSEGGFLFLHFMLMFGMTF